MCKMASYIISKFHDDWLSRSGDATVFETQYRTVDNRHHETITSQIPLGP